MVYNVRPNPESEGQAKGTVLTNKYQRRSAKLVLGSTVALRTHNVDETMYKISFEVGYTQKSDNDKRRELDCEKLREKIVRAFAQQVFTVGQQLFLSFLFQEEGKRLTLKLRVLDIELLDSVKTMADTSGKLYPKKGGGIGTPRGALKPTTSFEFKKESDVRIVMCSTGNDEPRNIIPPGGFVSMGIGGLDKQFEEIFVRAFVSRIVPPSFLRKINKKPIKGMLLYGPPGCGKTLIARTLAKKLNAKEPKIVAGPSILNKYVGESEKAIRDLFAEAEKDEEDKGENSPLHVIIFDEIDAICKQRGTDRSGSGVHDSLVNQLLSKIDGVNELNNILVIGMTNRKDMLDSALLRAGRLEIHVEIGLPDESGRQQILSIHTADLAKTGKLGDDVSIPSLASKTKNFTGAEIKSLCVRASQNMLARLVDMKTYRIEKAQLDGAKVVASDFQLALDGMKPMFAVRDDELRELFSNGIVEYSDEFEAFATRLQTCADQVRASERTRLLPLLLDGVHGSGKTALSAWAAARSGFPYMKRISADMAGILGCSPAQKVSTIDAIFQDAYKTPLACIILDDVERLIEYVPLGHAYNSHVLNALLVLAAKPPPVRERRLLVIATTSSPALLNTLGFRDIFMQVLKVPTLSKPESVLKFLSEETKIQRPVVMEIAGRIKGAVPVKKMLNIIEFARQEAQGNDADITCPNFLRCVEAQALQVSDA